jgi:hypothetical protein
MNQAEEHDDYMYEKGRQDAINEVREWLSTYLQIPNTDLFFNEFDEKFKVTKC